VPAEFKVDRKAVATILVVCVGAWLPLILACLWKIGVLEPMQMSWGMIIMALVSVYVGVLFPWIAIKQIRGALGMRISEEGITRGGVRIPWAEVTALEEPAFGTLVVKAPDRQITLQTYLFTEREALRNFVSEQVPALG
jgi:hypothetical protein